MLKKTLYFIIAALFLYIVYLKGCVINKSQPAIITSIDTVYTTDTFLSPIKHDTLLKPDYTYLPGKTDTLLIPIADTNYNKLKQQYANVSNKAQALNTTLKTVNIYNRTYSLDTFGTVYLRDTITNNQLAGRAYGYKLYIPKTTITLTKEKPQKAVFYLGAGVLGNKSQGVTQGNASLLFKTRSGNLMFGPQVATDFKNGLSYGASVYFKL